MASMMQLLLWAFLALSTLAALAEASALRGGISARRVSARSWMRANILSQGGASSSVLLRTQLDKVREVRAQEMAGMELMGMHHADASLLLNNGSLVSISPQEHLEIKDEEREAGRPSANGVTPTVVGMVLLQDSHQTIATGREEQPEWLQTLLALVQHHCNIHGHRMVIRFQAPTQLHAWQRAYCTHIPPRFALITSKEQCERNYERENINWEKEAMMLDYLEQPGVERVLMMDADIMFTQPKVDTIMNMAAELEKAGKDILMSDEDWRDQGKGRANGGMLLAKKNDFTRWFFKEVVTAHTLGPLNHGKGPINCMSNEQVCVQALMDGKAVDDRILSDKVVNVPNHFLITSGSRYNRGSCAILNNCGRHPASPEVALQQFGHLDLEALHFMGSMKSKIWKILNDTSVSRVDPGMAAAFNSVSHTFSILADTNPAAMAKKRAAAKLASTTMPPL